MRRFKGEKALFALLLVILMVVSIIVVAEMNSKLYAGNGCQEICWVRYSNNPSDPCFNHYCSNCIDYICPPL